jgi:hypothetical protein
MEQWLRCTITPGMFPGEVGVEALQFDGSPISLFAPEDSADWEEPLNKDRAVAGWLRVRVVERKGDHVLVRLPRECFLSSYYVTVKSEQLQTRPQKQRV